MNVWVISQRTFFLLSKYRITTLVLCHCLRRNDYSYIMESLYEFNCLPNLTVFSIAYAYAKILDSKLFTHFPKLKRWCLTRTEFPTIEPNVFANEKHLTCLELSGNSLEALSADSFLGLEDLKELSLLYSPCLKNIDPETFSLLSKLSTLDIGQITALKAIESDMLAHLTNLKVLNLRQCSIEKIDLDALSYLVNLEELNISLNKIRDFDLHSLLPKCKVTNFQYFNQ